MIRYVDPLVSLPAADMGRAVAFYTGTLGMRTMFESPERDFYIFQGAEDGATMIGLHAHPEHRPAPDPGGIWIWLKVEEIAPLRARLEKRGVAFLGETRDLGPGFEAVFTDSEGNVLRLYEPLREVRRSIDIKAPAASVFRALTHADAIERWFTTISNVRVDAREGGAITFIDPIFGRVTGRVTRIVENEYLAFEFTENWPRTLEFTLSATLGATRLELVQRGFDAIEDRDFGVPAMRQAIEAACRNLEREFARIAVP